MLLPIEFWILFVLLPYIYCRPPIWERISPYPKLLLLIQKKYIFLNIRIIYVQVFSYSNKVKKKLCKIYTADKIYHSDLILSRSYPSYPFNEEYLKFLEMRSNSFIPQIFSYFRLGCWGVLRRRFYVNDLIMLMFFYLLLVKQMELGGLFKTKWS